MGESPQSERRDGETRPVEAEQTPRDPGEGGERGSTVHLRVRDADTRTAADPDLPEASAALTDPRPTPRTDETPDPATAPDTPSDPTTKAAGAGAAGTTSAEAKAAGADGAVARSAEVKAEMADAADATSGDAKSAEATSGSAMSAEAKAGGAKAAGAEDSRTDAAGTKPAEAKAGAADAAGAKTAGAESADVEDADEEPAAPAPAGAAPTMTLRPGDLTAADEAADKGDSDADDAPRAGAVAEPTMTLRLGDLPAAAKTGGNDAAKAAAPAVAEPTMTLRLGDLPAATKAAATKSVEVTAADAKSAGAKADGAGAAAEKDAEAEAAGVKADRTDATAKKDSGAEAADAGDGDGDGDEERAEPTSGGPSPTMTLRLGDLPAAAKGTEDGGEPAAAADGPEPTMNLRVDKDRPERTVMLRLPKDSAPGAKAAPAPGATPGATSGAKAAASGSGPKAGAAAGSASVAKAAAGTGTQAGSAAGSASGSASKAAAGTGANAAGGTGAAAGSGAGGSGAWFGAAEGGVPQAPVAVAPGPESTIEALEVLKALSARPMTPLRRAVKRITIWGVFLAVVLGVLTAAQLLRPLPTPKAKLSLADSFTFAGDPVSIPWPAKGQAAAEVVGVGDLGSSGEQKPVPIASVTKVMNAYLILQAHPLKKGQSGPEIVVDKRAAQESGNGDESTVTLTEGQKLTQYEALEMLMLPSANNVARLLARWDSGSEEAFVKKMNDTAAQLGMGNTTYADPAGYNNDTKSTAKDQLKLAEQVMKIDIFRQIVAEPDTRFNGQRVYNTNALLGKNGNIGVKTGSSTPAQSCLMWAATKDIGGVPRMVLGVTLGQPQTKEEMSLVRAAQPPSQRINVAAQSALVGQTLAKQGEVVGHVDDGVGGTVPVVAAKDLTVAGWNGVTAHLTLTPLGKIAHTLPAGTRVGTLSAGDGDSRIEVPVTLQSDLAPPSIGSRLLRLG